MNIKWIFIMCIFLVLAPWAWFVSVHGIPTIPPEFVDDSIYYYTRMGAVAEGYPFIGNPYFKEHAGEMASAFFGADWLAALPLLIGIPLIPATILNMVVWIVLFIITAYALFRALNLSARASAYGVIALVLTQFWLIERPVAMQIVFPAYLLFLYTLTKFFNEASPKNAFFLGSSIALSFYLYTYLWMAVVVTVGFAHLMRYESFTVQLQRWWRVDLIALCGALPMVYYTFLQTHHTWYWETVARIGLIETRTFGTSGVILALVVFLGLGLAWYVQHSRRSLLILTGLSLLVVSFSNVVTGKDLETAVHFMRFVTLWVSLCAVILLSELTFTNKKNWILGTIATVVVLMGIVDQLQTTKIIMANTRSVEVYAPVFDWINQNTPKGSVIMADDKLAQHIPLMTHSFVLFHPNGGLYLMSNTEMQDRYLASRLFQTLSTEDIIRDMRLYAGAGNAIHSYKTENRRRAFCRILKSDCASPLDRVGYWGEEYFENMKNKHTISSAKPLPVLKNFGVEYVIVDSTKEDELLQLKKAGAELIDTLGTVSIYRL